MISWTQTIMREVATRFPRFSLRKFLVWFWPILVAKLSTINTNTILPHCVTLVLSVWLNRHKLQKKEQEPPQLTTLLQDLRACLTRASADASEVPSATLPFVSDADVPYKPDPTFRAACAGIFGNVDTTLEDRVCCLHFVRTTRLKPVTNGEVPLETKFMDPILSE